MVEIGTRTAVPQFTYTILSKIKSDTKNHYQLLLFYFFGNNSLFILHEYQFKLSWLT